MSAVRFKGIAANTVGDLPNIGAKAPHFELVASDFSSVSLSDFKGKKVILNIFASLDTSVCAASVTKFNEYASKLDDTVVLGISMDLPTAHKRFCDSMKLKNIIPLSDFRTKKFGHDYGILMIDGPLNGLLARAVIVLNKNHEVVYKQLVDEITNEPDYESALKAL